MLIVSHKSTIFQTSKVLIASITSLDWERCVGVLMFQIVITSISGRLIENKVDLGNPVYKLDSTTTSLQSGLGLAFQSQYKNIRTYSNLYPNPSKGFSLPSINMKTSSIFYEKQRLGVGSGLKFGHESSNSKHFSPFSGFLHGQL